MRKGKKKGVFRRIAAALLAVALILTAIPAFSLRESQASSGGTYKWKVRIQVSYNAMSGTDADVRFKFKGKGDNGQEFEIASPVLDKDGNDFERGDNDSYEFNTNGIDPWQITSFGISCGWDTLKVDNFEVWLPNGTSVGSESITIYGYKEISDSTAWWDVPSGTKQLKRTVSGSNIYGFDFANDKVHLNKNAEVKIADLNGITVKDNFSGNTAYNPWTERNIKPLIGWNALAIHGGTNDVGIVDVLEDKINDPNDESKRQITVKSGAYTTMRDKGIGSIKAQMKIDDKDGTNWKTKDLWIYRNVFSLKLPKKEKNSLKNSFKTSKEVNLSESIEANEDLYINGDEVIFKAELDTVYGMSLTDSATRAAATGIINWIKGQNKTFVTLYKGNNKVDKNKICDLKLDKVSGYELTFKGKLPDNYETKTDGVTLSLDFNGNGKQPVYNGNSYHLEIGKSGATGKEVNPINEYYSSLKVDNKKPTITTKEFKGGGITPSSYQGFDILKKTHQFIPEVSEQIYSDKGYEKGIGTYRLTKKDNDQDPSNDYICNILNSNGNEDETPAPFQKFPAFQDIKPGVTESMTLALGEALEGEFTLFFNAVDVANNKLEKKVDVKLDNKAPEVDVHIKTNPRVLDTRTMKVSFDIRDYSGTGRVNYCFVRDGKKMPQPGSEMEKIPVNVSEGQWCFVEQNSLSATTSTILKVGKEEEFVGTLYYYTEDECKNTSTDKTQSGAMYSTRIELYNKTGSGTVEFGVAPGDEGKKAVENYIVTPHPGENAKFCYYYEQAESGVKTELMEADKLEDNKYQPGSSHVSEDNDLEGQWSLVYYFEDKSSGVKSEIKRKTLMFDNKTPEAEITWETPDEARDTQRVHINISDSSRVKDAWYKADDSLEKISLPVNADGNVDCTVEVTADTSEKNKFNLVLGANDENGHLYVSKDGSKDESADNSQILENSRYYLVSTPEAELSLENNMVTWNEIPVLSGDDEVTITALTRFKEADYQKLHAQVSYSLDGVIWNDWKDVDNLSFNEGEYKGSLNFKAQDMKLYQGLNSIYARMRIYSGEEKPQMNASVPFYVSDTGTAPYVQVYYDTKAPECTLEYDTNWLTKSDVVATLTVADELTGVENLTVETGSGLTAVENSGEETQSGVYQYRIEKNIDTNITVTDLKGNKTTVPIQVNWIDKEKPEISVESTSMEVGARSDANIQVLAQGVSDVRFALIPITDMGAPEDIMQEDGTINPQYYDYFSSPKNIPASDSANTASRISMFSTESGRQGQEYDRTYDINMKGLNGMYQLAAEARDPLGNITIETNLCQVTMKDAKPSVKAVSYSESPAESEGTLPDRNIAELTFDAPVFVISDSELEALRSKQPNLSLEELCKGISATKYDTVWKIPVDKAEKKEITYMDELDRPDTYELDTTKAVRSDGNTVKATVKKNGEVLIPEAGKWASFETKDEIQVVLETDKDKHSQGGYLWIDDQDVNLNGFTVNEAESIPYTPEPTEMPTPEPTESATPEPTESATPEPTESATPEPTESATPEPTESATPDPTEPETSESVEGDKEVLQLSAVNNEMLIEEIVGTDGQQENNLIPNEETALYEKLVLDAAHGCGKGVRSINYNSCVLPAEKGGQDSVQSHVYMLSAIDETAAQPPEESTYVYSNRDKTNHSVTVKIPVDDPESGITGVTTPGIEGKEWQVYSSDGTITDTFDENGSKTYTIINGAGMESQCTVTVENINKTPITTGDYSVEYYYTDYKGDKNKSADVDKAYRFVRAVVKLAGDKNLTVRNNMGSTEVYLYNRGEFRYQVIDEYGNTAEIPVSHDLYDKIPPVITTEVLNTNPTKDPIKVKIQVRDTENGGVIAHCAAESVSDGGECGELNAVNGETGVYDLEIGRNGKYMVRAYDLAGNYAESTFLVTNINADAPEMEGYTLSPEGFTGGPVTAKLQFKLGESQNKRVKIKKIEPVSGVEAADVTYTDETITFKKNGTVSVWFEDQFGNQNMGIVTVSNIVNEPPHLSAKVELIDDGIQAVVTFGLLNKEGMNVKEDDFGRKLSDITISSSILDYSNKDENSTEKETYVTADKAQLIATENGVYQVTAFDAAGNTQKLGVIINGIDRAPAKVKSVEWKYKYLSKEDNWSEKDGSGSHNVTEENDNGILLTSRQESKGQIINTPATNRKVEVTVVTDKPVTQVGAKKEASEKNSMDYTDDGTFSFNLQAKNKNITQYLVSVDLIDRNPPVLKLNNPELVFVENAKLKDDVYSKDLLTAGLEAYDIGKDGKKTPIDTKEINISYGEDGHVFDPNEMNNNKYNREKPYYIIYSVKDAVGNETTLKQTITLIGKNDTVALINGKLPSMTNSISVDNGTIAVTLKNHGGKSYIKYEKGFYTMGEMKSRGTLMSEKNGIPTVEGLSEGWYTVSVQTDKRDYFTIQVYVMPTREKEEGKGTK